MCSRIHFGIHNLFRGTDYFADGKLQVAALSLPEFYYIGRRPDGNGSHPGQWPILDACCPNRKQTGSIEK